CKLLEFSRLRRPLWIRRFLVRTQEGQLGTRGAAEAGAGRGRRSARLARWCLGLGAVSQRYPQSEREDVEDHRREPLINVTFDLRLLGSRDLGRNHGPHVRLPNVRLEGSEPGHLTPVGGLPEENEPRPPGALGTDDA